MIAYPFQLLSVEITDAGGWKFLLFEWDKSALHFMCHPEISDSLVKTQLRWYC